MQDNYYRLFSRWEEEPVKKLNANAEKQRRYRDRQKLKGKKELRGYVTPEAQQCYQDLADKSGWTDSELLSNALRITYAAYKCGQIKLLNEWLKDHGR
ncbi:hypothetical protein [Neptunicella sp. SCSIO 80796]|uniref:hypothetical protein n=1 Tax=Neptunicella plasticusilytica TaxID=3117012 RepID=UPI003A4DF0E4